MKHTPICEQTSEAHNAWVLRWPNFCRLCGATGVLYHPGVYRYPDNSGEPPSEDFCDECLALPNPHDPEDEHGHCPRCGEYGIAVGDDTRAAMECPHCGCAGGVDADDFMPVVYCDCWQMYEGDYDDDA